MSDSTTRGTSYFTSLRNKFRFHSDSANSLRSEQDQLPKKLLKKDEKQECKNYFIHKIYL